MMSFVNVTLKIPYETKWGDSLAVTGSSPLLGNWDPSKAKRMSYEPSLKFWETTFPVSGKQNVEYKYLVHDELGNVRAWDGGDNRQIEMSSTSSFGPMEIRDFWRDNVDAVDWLFNRSSAFADAIMGRTPSAPPTLAGVGSESTVYVRFFLRQQLLRTQKLYVSGSIPELGAWDAQKALPLSDSSYPEWQVEVPVFANRFPIEFKFFVRDGSTGKPEWETGGNRVCNVDVTKPPSLLVLHEGVFKGLVVSRRMAGVAVPVFSLRTQRSLGCGEFQDLALLSDWAKLLPINDTRVTNTWRDSYPYSSLSVFALHPMYINIDALDLSGALKADITKERIRLNGPTVDFEETMRIKIALLKKLFKPETQQHFMRSEEFKKFFIANKDWLAPYAVFLCLKEKFGTAVHQTWPKYRTVTSTDIDALAEGKLPETADVPFHYFVQYHLAAQLSAAVQHAKEQGIAFKGDLPIGVDSLSVDTWISPELFRLGKQTGAPPDAFSTTGQNWGFPTYDWVAMKKENFRWWRRRLECMAQYFGAYRIDHVLGFFRIWEIPSEGVSGLLGRFVPVQAIWRDELANRGIWDVERLTKPYVTLTQLANLFDSQQIAGVIKKFFNEPSHHHYEFKLELNSEKKIAATEESDATKAKLAVLLANVVLLKDEANNDAFHFRIEAPRTSSFADLEDGHKRTLYDMYVDYFYRRQDHAWAISALDKLPMMQNTTRMLVCGEDLGMVPACVQGVLDALSILGLRIQRMPKDPKRPFDDPREYPYLSVATPSVHDTSTIRGWWEEDRDLTQQFFNIALEGHGAAPQFAETWVVERILQQHLACNSMLSIFALQDLFAIEEKLRVQDPNSERINVPAVKHHYWKYRMHLTLEDLMQKHGDWGTKIRNLVQASGRLV